jgi:hypothetical protein
VGHRTTFGWDSTGTFLSSVTTPSGVTSVQSGVEAVA